ncbi:hypothetical protein VTK26DRAFT_2917 [Humicola hyalothermophila]
MAECQVALVTGCPKTSVHHAIRKFVEATGGTFDGERVPAMLLWTTLWILQEQQRHVRRGLMHRGIEIFFSGGKSLWFYHACPRTPEENARFTNKFPTCKVPDEIHASLPLWVPFIVGIRNISRWSYTTICDALKVNLWSREDDFQKWRERYRSRTLVSCHLEVDCSESQLPGPKRRRHHARKRKRSAEPESRTLRPDSIEETQFRATSACQHREPAVSRHDKCLTIRASSALEREAETAPQTSQGQRITRRDVSVRAMPAPHNSPTATVHSESGSGSGQAVSAGLPESDVGVDSWHILLAVAAAQAGGNAFTGEETAGAIAEHESDQRAGDPPVGSPLDAAVGIAASPLQLDLPVPDETDQHRSEESLGNLWSAWNMSADEWETSMREVENNAWGLDYGPECMQPQ